MYSPGVQAPFKFDVVRRDNISHTRVHRDNKRKKCQRHILISMAEESKCAFRQRLRHRFQVIQLHMYTPLFFSLFQYYSG